MEKVFLAEWHWEGPVHRHKDGFQLVVECYPKSNVAHVIPSLKAISSVAISDLSSLCLSNWLCLPNSWLFCTATIYRQCCAVALFGCFAYLVFCLKRIGLGLAS